MGRRGRLAATILLTPAILLCALMPASSGAEERVCTLVGCNSAVVVRLANLHRSMPGARSVTICLDHRCSRSSASGKLAVQRSTAEGSAGPHEVLIVVHGRGDRVLLRVRTSTLLKLSYPNGVECGPACFHVTFALKPALHQLELVSG